jgi:hypothetical protein
VKDVAEKGRSKHITHLLGGHADSHPVERGLSDVVALGQIDPIRFEKTGTRPVT